WLIVPDAVPYYGGVVTSPLLNLPGAVVSPDPVDEGLAWHYGDPLGEQRAAERGAILLDGWRTGLVRLTGSDRLSWLQEICTQDLADASAGTATETLWLTAQGRVSHWADVCVLDNAVLLATATTDAAGSLAEFLVSMQFHADVQIEDLSPRWASVTVAGAGAVDAAVDHLGMTQSAAGHVYRTGELLVRSYR